jgi:hypothetical protein
MSLYICIKDGQPFEHPITKETMALVFPHEDINNLSENFMLFERVEKRDTQIYEIYEGNTYVIDGSVVKDSHNFRLMTLQEKDTYIQTVTQEWQAYEFYCPSWIYSDKEGGFVPPFPPPKDGKNYIWDEPTTNWVLAPKIESSIGTNTGI